MNSGKFHPDDLMVYIAKGAYLDMMDHSIQGGAYEVGGFLLGGYHQYKGNRYVDIATAVPALKAKSEKTHLTFSNESQKEFHATVAERYPDSLVLGWYHTHPRYSVFLSDHDMFVQRSFFSSEHHVAIVIDPYQHHLWDKMGVFLWEKGDVSQGYHPVVYHTEKR